MCIYKYQEWTFKVTNPDLYAQRVYYYTKCP